MAFSGGRGSGGVLGGGYGRTAPGPGAQAIPEGPFRTKNSTALESVVFCYRRSFFFIFCRVFLPLLSREKQTFLSPLRSVLLRPYRIFSPHRKSLSVVFLVWKGPLGIFSASSNTVNQLLLVRQGQAAYSTAQRQASSEFWAPSGLHPAQSSMAITGRMPAIQATILGPA